MPEFDFDEWTNLYRKNPVEFEQRRKEILYSEIAKAPVEYRNKLHSLQKECDTLSSTLSPLEAVTEISKLMLENVFNLQDSFLDLGVAYNEYNNIKQSDQNPSSN